MIHHLSEAHSLVQIWINELRDVSIQHDRMRFRRNIERIGEVAAYEISKTFSFIPIKIQTPLEQTSGYELKNQPVIATILRAGLPLFQGLMNYLDKADSSFVAAYRKHDEKGFHIEQSYVTAPNLEGRPLIIADPMLATGASFIKAIPSLLSNGTPSEIHIVCVIASQEGIDFVQNALPNAHIWVGAIDPRLNDKSYILPGLGDAGDLCFGEKLQN
jgi:uracil phosphoribosyltransferase